MSGLPRGTVTFLFTDIEGSTRLWQSQHVAMEAAYACHDDILRDAATTQGGTVYKVVGDAFQVAFPTAPQALAAALQAQVALQGEDWLRHGLTEPLRVRMALHTGAVDPDPDGDYRSPVLNRLGRLLGAGHGGQVLLSDATMMLARDLLPEGATLQDLGPHRLKDLLEPEHLHQLGHPKLIGHFPPLRTLTQRGHNLPLQPTPLIGREREVEQLTALITQPQLRLLTLTGPGGTGKTRLALQMAAEMVEIFPDGVWFVDLAPVTDPDVVTAAISAVLGIREDGGTSLVELLLDYLRQRQLLLVLDNFEQIVESASLVGTLVASAPYVKVLITSRIPLRLRAEREYAVPPLSLPRRRPPPTALQLTQYEAVRLFLDRAQAVKSEFIVTGANAPAIAEICHRLDGLPLAIELAAARIRLFPPEAMLRRLEQRLPLLTGGARDLPLRQQTLRGAIAWSYELLTPDERALFRRLSVFAGGATPEAVEAVAAGQELELDVFTGLERLVAHSLVRQTETEGEPRFSMLETIRAFGLEELEHRSEADEAQQRHAAHFLTVAKAAAPALEGHGGGQWLDRLEIEHDNLRAALGWSLMREPETALRLAAALHRFWLIRGYLGEGRAWLERALAAAPTAPADVRTRALSGAGHLAHEQGDLKRAVDLSDRGLKLAKEKGASADIALSTNGRGLVAIAEGDLPHAMVLFEEALALAREVKDFRMVTRVLNNLGVVMWYQGDLGRAAAFLGESLALERKSGNSYGVGVSLNNLGQLAYAQGDLVRATALLEESVIVGRKVGDQSGVANSLINLGNVSHSQGDLPQAVSYLREGLLLSGEIGVKAVLAEGVEIVARVVAATDPVKAVRLAGAGAGLRLMGGMPMDAMDAIRHERVLDALRQSLGDADFAAAWAEGQALSLEEAVATALSMLELI